MTLIIRDIKNNLKPFIYWALAISVLVIVLVLAYPAAIEKMKNLDEVINTMPKELIAAFNLENYDWSHILNYFAYEFQFVFLACAIYATTIGASIFSKEESNKTIMLVYSKPITRSSIFFSKLFVAVSTILVFNIFLFVFTVIALRLGINDQVIEINKVFNLYLAMYLIQMIFMAVGILLSVIMKKSKSSSLIASGLVIFTYMIGVFSKIAEVINNFVYLSPLHYFIPDQIVRTGEFELKYILITICTVAISILISWKIYQKKDFNI